MAREYTIANDGKIANIMQTNEKTPTQENPLCDPHIVNKPAN